MTANLIPPSLADMGCTFWGTGWVEHIADALELPIEQVQGWEQDPTTIPAEMEDRLREIGAGRLEEIQIMLAQMAETGLRRQP